MGVRGSLAPSFVPLSLWSRMCLRESWREFAPHELRPLSAAAARLALSPEQENVRDS